MGERHPRIKRKNKYSGGEIEVYAGRLGTEDGRRPHSRGKMKDLALSLQGCAFLSKAGYRTQEEKKIRQVMEKDS